MKILLFGASGMVGQGVLRECLQDAEVTRVVTVGRSPIGTQHEKLADIVHADFFAFEPIADKLKGFDACFFCLGVSSLGLTEAQYARVTYDVTMAAARVLVKQNPGMTFVYVSGTGTDSSEKGRSMWARVKGKTENALLNLPFKAAMFRPGFIQPLHGIQSKTALYRIPYTLIKPFIPLLMPLFPKHVTTTERVGRAMINGAKRGFPKPILETADINDLGKS